jgi:phage baseplate assembly protein V
MTGIRNIDKYLAGKLRKIILLATRGRVLTKDEAEKHQHVQARFLKNETLMVERLQDYGFSSRPLKGAEGLGIFLGGNRDQGVLIAVGDRRFRIALEEGEAAVYATDGSTIIASMKCLKTGEVVIDAGGGQKVTINAGGDVDVNATGDVTVDGGDISVTGSGTATVEGTSVLLGASAVLANAKHNDQVTQSPNGGGATVGYINALGTKVKSE